MPVEIVAVRGGEAASFFRKHERESLKTLYGFSVVWHEQAHDVAAVDGEATVGALRMRIAASLAHVERVVVEPSRRRGGVGSALLDRAAQLANYYNCHKMTLLVPHRCAAQMFFEANGYHVEAVLPQHTFKLDMAVLRKFLL